MQALRVLLPLADVARFALDFGKAGGIAHFQPSLASADLRYQLAAVKTLSVLCKVCLVP